jgi:glycogen(starch) synthase
MRRAVIELKEAFKPDLVHISSLGPSMFFHLESTAGHASPLLVTAHAYRYAPSPPTDSLLKRTLNAADWVTSVSAALLDEIRCVFPEVTSRSSVIYNGIQQPSLEPTPLPFDPPVILGFGRLIHSKGFDVALDAFASVRDRFPSARFILAGDGQARTELEKQVTELGIDDAVSFIGWVAPDQVISWINTATMVVIPSRSEPFGLVALEAGLMARPVVATKVGGLAEIILHERTGILVPNEEAVSMAEGIAYLLDHPADAVRMGREARERVIQEFSMERCVDSYDRIYRKLIARG